MSHQFDFDLSKDWRGSCDVSGSGRSAGYGANVSIYEHNRADGTCYVPGCTSKKLLVSGAHVAEDDREMSPD